MSRTTIFLTFLASATLISSPAYTQSCTSSTIMSPSPFMGNNDELFKLSDGSFWQVKYAYEYLYAYYPSVVICSATSILIIKNKKINVISIPSVIETKIDGDFKGWEGETIYKLRNGQIWQQSGYHYHYHYAYAPNVVIYKVGSSYKMKVLGDNDQPISVTRIK